MKRALRIFMWLMRNGIGLLLVYSGLLKVTQPFEFLNSVMGYDLLGAKAATGFAGVLPFLELAIGLALVTGLWVLGAALMASLLFAAFSVAQVSVLVRGINVDCGCFAAGESVSWVSLLRTLGLLAGTMCCMLSTPRTVAGDLANGSDASTDVEPPNRPGISNEPECGAARRAPALSA